MRRISGRPKSPYEFPDLPDGYEWFMTPRAEGPYLMSVYHKVQIWHDRSMVVEHRLSTDNPGGARQTLDMLAQWAWARSRQRERSEEKADSTSTEASDW